jgi:uridine kinase
MPIYTNQLKEFDLTYIEDNGFILRFPTVYNSDSILPYSHHQKMFKVFGESREWAKIMRIQTSGDLNEVVSRGKINDIIKIDETLQSNKLLNLAKDINDKRNRIKIVCFAGPSSSGKTTTTKKLSMYLESFGITPKVISMDDYYLEREDAVKDENGEYDYECLEALDLKLFNKQISQLLKGNTVDTPVYNFVSGKKEFTKTLTMNKNDILLIEGIHALDPKILTNIPRNNIIKVYISPMTELNIDNHNRISTADNRLLRRMIRDARTRGKGVEDSIKAWADVRDGEEKYIFPYQDEADYTLNTAAIYELGVLRTYVEPLLFDVDVDSPYYEDAKRLMRFISLFLPIPADAIPEDAIIREFIGESYFENK